MAPSEMNRFNWRDVIAVKGDDEQAWAFTAKLDEYFSQFAEMPRRDIDLGLMGGSHCCVNCGALVGGFLGTVRWGLVHGEAFCDRCNWPYRAHHRPSDEDGEIFSLTNFLLPYHEDFVDRGKLRPEDEWHEVMFEATA